MNNTSPDTLSPLGHAMQQSLARIEQFKTHYEAQQDSQTLHATNMGQFLSSAYESLRNASENAEDHLLLQRATKRFFVRNIYFGDETLPEKLAEELIIELTQAQYLANDSVTLTTIAAINKLARDLFAGYRTTIKAHPNTNKDRAQTWLIDVLSVRAEQLIHPPYRKREFAHFAYAYYNDQLTVGDYIAEGETVNEKAFPVVLYTGVHRSLLRSDDANIRSMLLELYNVSPTDTAAFIEHNQQYDILFDLQTTDRVTRVVSKNGAHLRIIKSTFFDDDNTVQPATIARRDSTLSLVEQNVTDSYVTTKQKLQSGIVKSVVFLLITKAIIGLAIEIPYDIVFHGEIVLIPLLINLFFPAVFIALSTLTLKMPGAANTRMIVDAVDDILYERPQSSTSRYQFKTFPRAKQPLAFTITYGIMFIVGVGSIIRSLHSLDFSMVQGGIFIVFLSTAAFLAYRLSLGIKELEIVSGGQNIIGLIRDFLYTPFIFIGHQISFRYAKMNIVATILDNIIELPLKTTLRLVRQWTAFLNNRKEEIL